MSNDWAQIQGWHPHWVSLPERIQEYAQLTGTDPGKVVSLKFRPVAGISGEQPDFSELHRFNSYMYPWEYDEVIDEAPELERVSQAVCQVRGTKPPILWIEHETGAEFLLPLAVASQGLGAIVSLITIGEKIRKAIKKEPKKRLAYGLQEDLRIELRHLDHQGNLSRQLIVTTPVGTSADPDELARLVSASLPKLDTEAPT